MIRGNEEKGRTEARPCFAALSRIFCGWKKAIWGKIAHHKGRERNRAQRDMVTWSLAFFFFALYLIILGTPFVLAGVFLMSESESEQSKRAEQSISAASSNNNREGGNSRGHRMLAGLAFYYRVDSLSMPLIPNPYSIITVPFFFEGEGGGRRAAYLRGARARAR